MSGHVFVVGADLVRLSCDDVLVPTDRSLRVTASWLPLIPGDQVAARDDDGARLTGGWDGAERVRELPGCGSRRVWLIDTVDEGGDADDAADEAAGRGLAWLLEGAREALAAVARREVAQPAHGRARRLVGLPALGTGWGGAAGRRGELLRQLLPVLRAAAEEHGFDVALVLRRPSDLAAAQRVRRAEGGGWDLPDDLHEVAGQLGARARAGGRAVFLGAGVSAAAGRPTWLALLDDLADEAGLDDDLRAGLAQLPPQDSAALLARELGREALAGYVQDRFGPGPYALAHALVAGLPVREFVTTNYDPLVELAAADVGRPLRVLPFDDPDDAAPRWILKLHGDAAHPESVVLTREQYLEFGAGRTALAGVLQSLLLTRHVLFVGTSMLDDDLIRIAHQVRSVLTAPQPEQAGPRRSGTVLALQDDPVRARLWEQDVDTVAMAGRADPAPEAARRLEVLLDLLGCVSAEPTGYLLDPAYRGLLDEEETALSGALGEVAAVLDGGSAHSWAGHEVRDLLRRLGAAG
ncbi:SIR2 family protein [Modestobacter sp. NPDC049651]|uniref:SIR2 family NAD-dependent protein deacylase n=1 Tax=Modestobacter sp. NPDC049651 TaxID=3155777 RepID=UPI003407B4AD